MAESIGQNLLLFVLANIDNSSKKAQTIMHATPLSHICSYTYKMKIYVLFSKLSFSIWLICDACEHTDPCKWKSIIFSKLIEREIYVFFEGTYITYDYTSNSTQ